MSEKSENEIHDAYMKGLFEGKKEILSLLGGLIGDCMDEMRKQREAQE